MTSTSSATRWGTWHDRCKDCGPPGIGVADARRKRERGGAGRRPEVPQEHRHGPDRVVLVARDHRPRRGRPQGDRGAVLQHVRVRRERAAARGGHRDERARLRARRGRRPRRRSPEGGRGRRQRWNRRRVCPGGRRAAREAGLAGLDVQRRPVPRGARDGGGRPRPGRRRRGGRDHDEHVADRVAGVRVRRLRRTGARGGRGTTPATRGSTGSATTATAPTARTSASASSTTIPSSRSSSRSTTTRSTCSTTTAPRCSPRRGTAIARVAPGSAGGSSSAG